MMGEKWQDRTIWICFIAVHDHVIYYVIMFRGEVILGFHQNKLATHSGHTLAQILLYLVVWFRFVLLVWTPCVQSSNP